MNSSTAQLLAIAVILLAVRLPSFFSQQEMSKVDRLWFILIIFGLLGVGWFIAQVI
jgi:hypothetical protein